jgi:hypothetical protein
MKKRDGRKRRDILVGKVITKPGDPSQTLSCDHSYVEYFIPVQWRSVGLIMWHSSSTKVWENRWDGGEKRPHERHRCLQNPGLRLSGGRGA